MNPSKNLKRKYLNPYEQQSLRLPKKNPIQMEHIDSAIITEATSQTKPDDFLSMEYEKKQKVYFQEGFTVTIDLFIRKMVQDKQAEYTATHYPLLKMLKMVLKKFLMSEFEVVLYYYFLNKTKWHYEKVLTIGKDFPDLLNFTDVKNAHEYKAIFCYLFLSAFYVKCMLNEEQEILIFQNHVLRIYPNFLKTFSKWVHNDEPSFVIDLIQLHKISKQMVDNLIHSKAGNKYLDYNTLVDDILEICPHYNYVDSQNKTGQKKHKKNPLEEKSLVENKVIITNNDHNQKSLADSKIININNEPNQNEELPPLPNFVMTRSMRNSMNKSGEPNPKYMFDGSFPFFGMKKSNANNVNNENNGNENELNILCSSYREKGVINFFESIRSINFQGDSMLQMLNEEKEEKEDEKEENKKTDGKSSGPLFSEKLNSHFWNLK